MTDRFRARILAALAKVDAGDVIPETRRVRAGDILVRAQDLDPVQVEARRREDRMPDGEPIPVVEVSAGVYWAFGSEAATVVAWQETRPNTMARVAIIPLADEPEPLQ